MKVKNKRINGKATMKFKIKKLKKVKNNVPSKSEMKVQQKKVNKKVKKFSKNKITKNRLNDFSTKRLTGMKCTERKYSKFINKLLHLNDSSHYNDVGDIDDFLKIAEEPLHNTSVEIWSKAQEDKSETSISDPEIPVESEEAVQSDDDDTYDENICEEPSINFHLINGEEDSLLIINPNATVYFHGLLSLNVLHGSIEILGKHIDSTTSTIYEAYSPRGTAFLSIENKSNTTLEVPAKVLKKISKHYSNLESFILPGVVLLECRNIENKMIQFITSNISQILFPTELENNIQCIFKTHAEDWSVMKYNPEWEGLLSKVQIDTRTMLCGGKGVGKSTLLRYLINKSLERFEKILVIDLDPGQPEFTVPGCISVTVVKDAVLGPNYTHLREPERSIFVPAINISADHISYLSCIEELMNCTLPNLPTIINYMGYSIGIGIHLLAAAISYTKPTTVVQIVSTYISRNFNVDLTVEKIKDRNTLLDMNGPIQDFELIKINSMSTHAGGWELQPRQVREMCVLAYLSQMLSQHCDFITEKSVEIYSTKLSDVRLIHEGAECSPETVNASLVALCTKSNNCYDCKGWGIVRGICRLKKEIYLLTPLAADELEIVDHLVLGAVTLPPTIYIRNNEKVCGLVPYVYKGKLSTFAKAPKRAIVPKGKANT